jgi:pyruvate-formate lyase-activating enzyme
MESAAEEFNNLQYSELLRREYMPNNVYIQITDHCNLRCAMCGYHTAVQDSNIMSDDLYEHVLSQCEEYQVRSLTFAPAFGETLLHPRAIEFLEEAVKRGFWVTVATNGQLLNSEKIKSLANMGLKTIQFSFFGYDKSSYEKTYRGAIFEVAIENLRQLKRALVEARGTTALLVNGTSVRDDPERTTKTRELLRSLGIEDAETRLILANNFAGKVSAGGARPGGFHSFKETASLPVYLCPLFLWSPGVMPDGTFTICGGLDNNGDLAIGNIKDSTMRELRAGPIYRKYLEKFRTGDLSRIPMCSKCDIPYGPDVSRLA